MHPEQAMHPEQWSLLPLPLTVHSLIALPAVDTLKGLPVCGSGASNTGLSKKVVARDEGTGTWPAVIFCPPSWVSVEPGQTSITVVSRSVVLTVLREKLLVNLHEKIVALSILYFFTTTSLSC